MIGDGVLNLKKPPGWTSHDVVAKVRGLLNGVKTGHAGTLDPAATGVLPVLIGQGTRIAEYLLEWDKEYAAVLRLGETTDTQDATGALLARRSVEGLTEAHIRDAVDHFRGPLTQVPPMYSAVKVGGVPLYKAARSGRTLQRDARRVMIYDLDVTAVVGRDVSLRVVCSKGTYIRTLCADIGERLGVGGHLSVLERTRVGPLTVDEALTIEAFAERWANGRASDVLIPLDRALNHLPMVVIDEPACSRILHGAPVPWAAVDWQRSASRESLKAESPVRLHDPKGGLLAVGRIPGDAGDAGNTQAQAPFATRSISVVKVLVRV